MSGRGKIFSFWLFLSAQWAKMWAYRCIFSRFSLISQAREVELRHFKSLKPSTWYGQCRKAIQKCSSLFLTAQWAKMWAYRPIFSRFSLISQAREVKLRHFKSLKSSTWYGQCREAMKNVQFYFWLQWEPTVISLAVSASYLRRERSNWDTLKV